MTCVINDRVSFDLFKLLGPVYADPFSVLSVFTEFFISLYTAPFSDKNEYRSVGV